MKKSDIIIIPSIAALIFYAGVNSFLYVAHSAYWETTEKECSKSYARELAEQELKNYSLTDKVLRLGEWKATKNYLENSKES